MYTKIRKCRICGAVSLVVILELGNQPLANNLKKKPEYREKTVSLTLVYCTNCALVQLSETINNKILFDQYPWMTGTSVTTVKYASIFFRRVVEVVRPDYDDLIIEIASNDGTFLLPFLDHGYHNVLGVDPAKNIAKIANRRGVRTLENFWDKEISEDIVSICGRAKIIIARNVIPHAYKLHDVIEGIAHALRDDGVGIIEFHYAGTILHELHYDSIYHEHLCYLTIKSISHLLSLYNLIPFHLDISPISGGSYVIYFSKKNRAKSQNFLNLAFKEGLLGANEIKTWKAFAKSCYEHRQLSRYVAASFFNKTVVGFGASARSSTYLNYCSFNSNQINAIIDNNPFKQGLYSPGTSIPIVDLKGGMRMNPDLIFILAWNFRDEIVQECRANGYRGEYLTAFPKHLHRFKG